MSKDLLHLAHEIESHLRLIQQAMRQPFQTEIAGAGLTGPQINVIEALLRKPGMSLKELSSELGLAHSTVSGIVDRLESRGILKRLVDGEDGRMSRIHLSKAVQDYVAREVPKKRLHPLLRALEKVKPARREEIMSGLRLLREAVEKSD